MDVFLSWSGKRSKAVAEAFREWLPLVIQAMRPWISPEIGKGERWNGELADRLEGVRVGILCLTSDNLSEPWLLFEAGAISKKKDSRACTFLLDIKPSDVDQPLGQFQHTVFEKGDVLKLIRNLNEDLAKAGGSSLPEKVLDASFEKFWPELEGAFRKILEMRTGDKTETRSEQDKLDEALDLLRAIARRISEMPATIGFLNEVQDARSRTYLANLLRHLPPASGSGSGAGLGMVEPLTLEEIGRASTRNQGLGGLGVKRPEKDEPKS